MDTWAIVLTVVGTVLSALFTVFLLTPTFDWMKRKLLRRRRLIIETAIEPGRTTREYGFAEPGIKVKFVNAGGDAVGIQDVRLIFSKGYGLPLPVEAPPPRSHPTLPVTIGGGCTVNLVFSCSGRFSLIEKSGIPSSGQTRGCPCSSSSHWERRGERIRGLGCVYSLDQNSLWHL